MLKFHIVRNKDGTISHIETPLSGYDLLGTPKLNKGCAFSAEECSLFHLEGLLPHHIETMEQQVARMYMQYQEHRTSLARNIYLNVLHDYNETLFYRLAKEHLQEMLPILYTPTVGEAVEQFSLELRKPDGLYISYQDRHQIDKLLENSLPSNTRLIVVTDGEAVLGIGDQGIGGIKICNAKLMVYMLCAGIDPHSTFAIQLDVGTNNPRLLSDPMYLGWRHERITGSAYDDFIELFVATIKKKCPYIYLHWEDFGRDNATRILTRYRDQICTLNGDMQSTGTVALACVLASCIPSETKLSAQRVVIFGAGTAGIGIAEQIVAAMQRHGLTEQEAHSRLWLIDKYGLLVENQATLLPFQKIYARSLEELKTWNVADHNMIGLLDVISHVKPTILIGCSAQGGTFSEEIIKTMATYVEHPIIMPLSNPTSKSEAKPEDLITWTKGQAIIATGSPFPDVSYGDRIIRIAQSNNAYAFPGIGLGAIAVKATHLSDDMLWAATESLSQCSPVYHDKTEPVLPKLSETQYVSRKIALSVARQARREGLAQIPDEIDLDHALDSVSWEPRYYALKKGF